MTTPPPPQDEIGPDTSLRLAIAEVRATLSWKLHHKTIEAAGRQLIEGRDLVARAQAGEDVGLAFSLWELGYQRRLRILDDVKSEIERAIVGRKDKSVRRSADEASLYEPRMGEIYVVASGDLVKIGFSVRHEVRISHLRTMSPLPLTIIHVRKGSMDDEFGLHSRFKAHRSHGEWFRREGDLAAWIEAGCPSS